MTTDNKDNNVDNKDNNVNNKSTTFFCRANTARLRFVLLGKVAMFSKVTMFS